ncbi:hypothetical protein P9597_09435 [Aneurinibacillus migulanus]|uniref:hypothetical protein n=1 Tax=Aneurinibacillus migulanus TaxID=47500 RepID=UPI002E1D8C46|nr:hypothetical protein [Aneurinibacillus migulanus]
MRNSRKISVEITKEKSPLIEIPELIETITWGPGTLHGITGLMIPFAAPFTSVMFPLIICFLSMQPKICSLI